MVPPISALYLFLLCKLMYPFRALIQDNRRMPKYMPGWMLLRIRKKWQRMSGNNCPRLMEILPKLMLLSRTQRVCFIHSLTGMTLTHHVDFCPRNIKHLRALFSKCFSSGKSFALEFNSSDNRILVLRFIRRNGAIFMSSELYDRFNGIIRKTEEFEVNLYHDLHLINLNVQIDQNSSGIASFFYAHGVLLPFQMDYDTCDFNIEMYSLVSFWWGDEKANRLSHKRLRELQNEAFSGTFSGDQQKKKI